MKTPEEIATLNIPIAVENSKGKLVFPFISRHAADEVHKSMMKSIKQAQEEAYNQALEDAYENSECYIEYHEKDKGYPSAVINKQSILKLKKLNTKNIEI